MSNGNEVEILFKTRAELQGARQMEDSIQRQIGQAKALGKDYSDLAKQLEQAEPRVGMEPSDE